MQRHIAFFIISFLSFTLLNAQKPKIPSSSQIYESIQKLNFLGSVLYVAAHPDDENTRLISYMSNHVKARTAYLSLTRGDGGQNLIGPEIRELLGVIRTQELLAARRIDGGEQIFTRANDFGYSKHPEETLSIWDKEQVLSDVVLAIRKFKPDVIINRFDHRTPGRTHGHHTASAILSLKAFDIAADEKAYPNMLNQVDVWQPKRLFYNTSWWRYGREAFEKLDKSNMINFDIGVYYPLKGISNNELASLASSQHLCQGFGRLSQRGTQEEYIEFIKGEALEGNDVFSGIDTSWNRVKGGKPIGAILNKIETNFNFKDPSTHVPQLIEAYKLLQNIDNKHWQTQKTKELKSIIEMCAGLYLEASASTPIVATNNDVEINIEALKRSQTTAVLRSVNISPLNQTQNPDVALDNNKKYNFSFNSIIPTEINTTSPYWLNTKGTLGMYHVANETIIGNPETKRALHANFIVDFDGYSINFEKDVIHRYSRPDKGELYRPFEIIPEASAKIAQKVIIFENNKPHDITVIVKAGKDNLDGHVEVCHPNDWSVYPKNQKISIKHKGETQTLVFTIIPPKNQSEGLISPIVHIGDKSYTKELIEIEYDHIPFQTVLLPSASKVVRLDIKKRGENIAYIQGAGDVVPESLQQIGYNVRVLKPEEINAETLSKFDAVVVGIRAYNTVEDLNFKQQTLFNFVEAGGNMIVQYNTAHRIKVEQLAPYDLTLSRGRVTDENAEVRFLNPQHPVLNFPNNITQQDFEGWTQERGLYFPNKWGKEFTAILSMNDKNDSPKDGSLLVAKHGKGHYIYTGLSFFREFPEGVSGAYRLFANMLSLGKEDLKLEAKLND
ncbi:PIG-L family deacetylase [Seonamhaeicola maritimus]|uniref:PIG-L family deacetylase n=1 Tax=Seonamhaeicola maritimus TaxID=2591822 RepID=A0A5C7GGM4_9FLAO|nr:PIG-L family deacetylase [Seonamhaeicola maritimus]TXG35801.1 PIG-L family deacetylase [Seonamhaeicola maritimus]